MPHLKNQSKAVSHFRIDIFPSHTCPPAETLLAHEVNDLEKGIRSESMIMPGSSPRDPVRRVRVDGHVRSRPKRLDHWQADSDIRNEVAVHYVHMKDRRPTFPNIPDGLCEARKICREDRRRNFKRAQISVYFVAQNIVIVVPLSPLIRPCRRGTC